MLEKAKALKNKFSGVSKKPKKGKPIGQYIVALDVGTEFVKALIGRIVGNEVEIIGVGRSHQELSDMQAGAISDIAAVVANCDKALADAEQQAEITNARTAIIGIAGELVKGTTTTVRFTRQTATNELTIEEVQRIIELVQQRAEVKARATLSWELGKDVEVRLVNSALVRIDIDGYKVTNPVGFQGRDLEVEMYTAFAPMIHIGALERTATEL